jgi:hypothetical protein
MTIDINIKVNPCLTDDFYLQWSYIYWWQMKINLQIMVTEAMKELNEIMGDVE